MFNLTENNEPRKNSKKKNYDQYFLKLKIKNHKIKKGAFYMIFI